MKQKPVIASIKQPRRRRRLAVEVYFVLYLSAIVLLLGTSPLSRERYDAELEEAVIRLLDAEFEVEVEKIALIVPFVPAGLNLDTAGASLRRDTVNMIRAHGSFSRAEFRVVAIVDTATGRSLPIGNALLVRTDDSSTAFHWRQDSSTVPTVWKVTVAAEADPMIPEGVSSPAIRRRISEVLETRGVLRDSVTFSVNVIPLTSQEMLMAARQVPMLVADAVPTATFDTAMLRRYFPNLFSTLPTPGGGAEFGFVPESPVVTAFPGRSWEQKIFINGPARDKIKTMKFSTSPGARVISQSDYHIVVGGTAPGSGSMDISVLAELPGSSVTTASFTVNIGKVGQPIFPAEMWAGQTYQIDFTAGDVSSEHVSIDVVENGIQIENDAPGKLNYTPKAAGTVQFTRYVDERLMDNHKAQIKPLPSPSVGQSKLEDDGSVTIETIGWGRWSGKVNYARLVVAKGNAENPELISSHPDPVSLKNVQRWRLRRKDRTAAFSFNVYAIDERGSGSRSEVRPFEF